MLEEMKTECTHVDTAQQDQQQKQSREREGALVDADGDGGRRHSQVHARLLVNVDTMVGDVVHTALVAGGRPADKMCGPGAELANRATEGRTRERGGAELAVDGKCRARREGAE